MPWPADCRFFDAIELTTDLPTATQVNIQVGGLFRYSDREPKGQATWDESGSRSIGNSIGHGWPLALDVYVDQQRVGALEQCVASEQEVATYTNPPRTAREEAVSQISGQIEIPAGAHVVRLVPRHMVDGLIQDDCP